MPTVPAASRAVPRELLGTLAHELRGPLATIVSSAQVLQTGGTSTRPRGGHSPHGAPVPAGPADRR